MSATIEDLVNAVREIAAERPDYVYVPPCGSALGDPGCVYVHEGQGSCLIGRALMKLGLIDPSIEGTEENAKMASALFDPKQLLSGLVDADADDHDELVAWLDDVQGQQDSEVPWGTSVQFADERTANRV